MANFSVLSAAEQVRKHLHEGIQRGVWQGEMPGVRALTLELGVNHKTVEAALGALEQEGVLVSQGRRRRRRIAESAGLGAARTLRIAVLLFGAADRRVGYVVEIMHELAEAGHAPFHVSRSLEDLKMDVGRVAELVAKTEADAWLVMAGSREVLAWFGEQGMPVCALFGRWGTAPIAGVGPQKHEAYAEAVRALAAEGHRRIVMVARPQRKLPQPGAPERAFLAALEAEGIAVSDYNFPLWENTKEGFHRALDALFRVTPPTALVVQETVLFAAVQQFLAGRGIRVPGDVSLVCADPDPTFEWRVPSIAHIRADSDPWVRHVLRWAARTSRGERYVRQLSSKAVFVPGGTIGPVKKG